MSQYYILRRDGCDYQAPDLDTMRTWAQDGRVLPTDMVYSPKFQSWYRAKDLRELRDVLPRVEGTPARPVPATTIPSPQRQAQQFWLRKGDKNYAADSLATILRWASEGNIGPDDFIYHPAYNKWFRAGDSPQLASRFPQAVPAAQLTATGQSLAAQPLAAQPLAAQPLAAQSVAGQPAPRSGASPQGASAESAGSLQRTVIDFKAAELNRLVQARRAEQAQSSLASRGNTRQGMAVAELMARAERDGAGGEDEPIALPSPEGEVDASPTQPAGPAAPAGATGPIRPVSPLPASPSTQPRPLTGPRPATGSGLLGGQDLSDAKDRSRPKLPQLPRTGSFAFDRAALKDEPTGGAQGAAARGTPATPAPATPAPATPALRSRRVSPPALPKEALEESPRPSATPAPAEPLRPQTPDREPAADERILAVSTGAPQAAPVADVGSGVDQGMAVPPDAAAAVAVRYDDRLGLMKLYYDIARIYMTTKDLRPGEAQETRCSLPTTGDELQGQTKRSIYTLLANRMDAHLTGPVANARAELSADEQPGFELFVNRARVLLDAFRVALPVVGQKPPERFVIGNSGRAKISPDESDALLKIEACLKGLISIKAK